MDTIESDYSLPPQWVLDLYKPEKIRPHVLVTKGDTPDSYVIRDVDFESANLFTFSLMESDNLPTKGESRVFVGSPEELYEELLSLDAKVILAFSARNIFDKNPRIPMAFGHSSDFSVPALVLSDYKAFKSWEEALVENPEQVGVAYEFINQHPLFWHVEKSRREGGRPNIVTGRGWHCLQWELFHKKNKKTGAPEVTVTIECGPGNYHDYNLDVYAPSFDEAVIKLASLIHKHYDSHGGFTDKTKKEPNDNFFREADAEAEAEAQAEAEEQQTTLEGLPITKNVVEDAELSED